MATGFRAAFREARSSARQSRDAIDARAFYAGDIDLFGTPLDLALRGELQQTIDMADEAMLRAARNALTQVVTDGKESLRDHVVRAGLAKSASEGRSGASLANAVRYDIFPRRGLAREPAALLYIQPTAHHIFEAFEEGSLIRAGGGKYLTIPIPGSPASRERMGPKPKGQTVIESMKARGVEFQFVPGRGDRPAMLVAQGVALSTRASGRERISRTRRLKSGALGANTASIPLFWLVPFAQMDKRLNLADEFDEVAREFMRAFEKAFAAEVAAINANNTRVAA